MPAVIALGDLAFALAALLLLWAIYMLFRPVLVALASHIPLIGSQLSGLIDAIVTDAYHWALANLKSTVRMIVNLVMAPIHWIATLIDGFNQLIADLYAAISYLRYTVLPRALATLWAQVQLLAGRIESYAFTLYQSGLQFTATQISALYHWTAAGLAAVDAYAYSLYRSAVAYTDASVTALEHYTQALAAQELAYTQASAAAAEHYAQALFTQAVQYTQVQVTDLDHWVSAALAQDMAWVGGQITALDRYIAASQAQTTAYVRDAVGVVESDLTNLRRGCTDNLCSGLSDLASLFNALQGDLGIAGLFALAAAFARDPRGAAADVEHAFGPVARDAAAVVRATVGL